MNIAGNTTTTLSTKQSSSPVSATRHHRQLKWIVASLGGAAALFLVSFLLPEAMSELALDLMSWCLVAALAIVSMVAACKLFETLLDL